MRPRRSTTPEPYVAAADVRAALDARAALRGPAEVMALLREQLVLTDEDKPIDQHYRPIRIASEGLRRLVVVELRRAGVKGVRSADHVLWAQVSGYRLSDLADALKRSRGVDPAAERQQWQERRHAERQERALAAPVPGEDKVPFPLTDSQRAYVSRWQAQRDVESVSIISHDPEWQAIRVKVVWKRPAYRYSVDNVRRYWVWPSPAAKRRHQQSKAKDNSA